MRLNDPAKTRVRNRLRRIDGQLRGILEMLDDDRDCTEILTQLAAASRALDKAGLVMVAAGLEQCILAGDEGSADRARLEKVFLSLG
ncbi:MAG: metal-sensitive transcriptional regulator [Actinomycetales bacterium]|nr:metal-sensitive transcriptional regulator [Actinomycetales bacterium]